jgi:hypothetical protein
MSTKNAILQVYEIKEYINKKSQQAIPETVQSIKAVINPSLLDINNRLQGNSTNLEWLIKNIESKDNLAIHFASIFKTITTHHTENQNIIIKNKLKNTSLIKTLMEDNHNAHLIKLINSIIPSIKNIIDPPKFTSLQDKTSSIISSLVALPDSIALNLSPTLLNIASSITSIFFGIIIHYIQPNIESRK